MDLSLHGLLKVPPIPGAGQQIRAGQLFEDSEMIFSEEEVGLHVVLQVAQEPLDLAAVPAGLHGFAEQVEGVHQGLVLLVDFRVPDLIARVPIHQGHASSTGA